MKQVKPLSSWNDDSATALLALDRDWRAIAGALRVASDEYERVARWGASGATDKYLRLTYKARALAYKIEQEISE